ncbi:MAG: glycoside hydrolase family 6 protein [Thermoleophilaceae bacterium]
MTTRAHARLAVLALLAAAAGPLAAAPAAEARHGQTGNPLDGVELYVDREAHAWVEWERLQRAGKARKAALVWKIAREPPARWAGKFTKPSLKRKIGTYIDRAEAEGNVPLLTVMRAEATKCSPTYQAGGPAEDRRTRRWYADFARVVGDSRAVIAFEPDSLGTVDCQARSRRPARWRLLRYGVRTLTQLPNTTVYIEAGASDWEPARKMARKLRRAGIGMARGFMLNATHGDWTRANIRYGLQLSRRVGGKHFVINTAQNGRGPVHWRDGRRRRVVWCNPGLRGLGPPPTTDTSHPRVDAYLWINRPGFVQGCSHGTVRWHLPKALTLARFATRWEAPPKGTRRGHFKRYRRSAFNITFGPVWADR